MKVLEIYLAICCAFKELHELVIFNLIFRAGYDRASGVRLDEVHSLQEESFCFCHDVLLCSSVIEG